MAQEPDRKEGDKVVALKATPVEVQRPDTEEDQRLMRVFLAQFGEEMRELHVPELTLKRFVRGYFAEKEREPTTGKYFRNYLDVHRKWRFDSIAYRPWDGMAECSEAWVCYMYGQDRQGHPVMYDEIGSANVKKVNAAFRNDRERLRNFRFRFMQRVLERKEYLSKRHGTLIYKHTMVMDLKGFGYTTHFTSEYRQLVKDILGEEQHLFPETLFKLYIVNAPWTFRAAWNVICMFIDPLTQKKISVIGSSYLKEMLKEIDIDQIPPKYGGSGTMEIYSAHDSEDYLRLQEEKNNQKKDTSDAKPSAPDSKEGAEGEGKDDN